MPTYNVARGSFMNAVVSAIRIASGRACQRATAFMQIYVQLLEGRARFPCGCYQISLSGKWPRQAWLYSDWGTECRGIESMDYVNLGSTGPKVSRLCLGTMGLRDMVPEFVKLP
jgi:hypothetical protein